jgi:hypothetical protein
MIYLTYLTDDNILCCNLGSNTLLCHDIYQNINKTGENQIIFNRENETVCSSSKTWHWFNATAQVPLKQVRYLSSASGLF